MTNRIIWRKWQDPMSPMLKGRKLPAAYEPGEDEEDPDFHAATNTFDGDDEDDGNPFMEGDGKTGGIGPCIIGPMGAIPVHESNLPSKLFNFWMGDTNFDLDEDKVSAIESVPGVEALDVYSRYRFRLAVGRSFRRADVLANIEKAVQPPPGKPAPALPAEQGKAGPVQKDPVATLRQLLSSAFPHWAVVEVAGGKFHGVGGATVDEVKAKVEKKYAAVAVKVTGSWEGE